MAKKEGWCHRVVHVGERRDVKEASDLVRVELREVSLKKWRGAVTSGQYHWIRPCYNMGSIDWTCAAVPAMRIAVHLSQSSFGASVDVSGRVALAFATRGR